MAPVPILEAPRCVLQSMLMFLLPHLPFAFCPRTPMLRRFKESEGNIDAYLHKFERYAENEGWSVNCHAIYLSVLLEGPALEVYHRLPASDANNYEVVKEALLRKYSLTSGDNRKKFFACKQNSNENALQFFSRLEHIIYQWILLSNKIDHSFEAFKRHYLRRTISSGMFL